MPRQGSESPIVLRGERAAALIYRLAPGIMLSTYLGYVDSELVRQAGTVLGAEIEQHGRIRTFSNALHQMRIEASAREAAAAVFKEYGDKISRSDILYGSRMMEMGLNLVSMLSGRSDRLRFHSSLESFEASIAEVVPGFRQLPALPPGMTNDFAKRRGKFAK